MDSENKFVDIDSLNYNETINGVTTTKQYSFAERLIEISRKSVFDLSQDEKNFLKARASYLTPLGRSTLLSDNTPVKDDNSDSTPVNNETTNPENTDSQNDTTPTPINYERKLKAEIIEILVGQGLKQEDLEDKTKAELIALIK